MRDACQTPFTDRPRALKPCTWRRYGRSRQMAGTTKTNVGGSPNPHGRFVREAYTKSLFQNLTRPHGFGNGIFRYVLAVTHPPTSSLASHVMKAGWHRNNNADTGRDHGD